LLNAHSKHWEGIVKDLTKTVLWFVITVIEGIFGGWLGYKISDPGYGNLGLVAGELIILADIFIFLLPERSVITSRGKLFRNLGWLAVTLGALLLTASFLAPVYISGFLANTGKISFCLPGLFFLLNSVLFKKTNLLDRKVSTAHQ
jgi:hypothetical protein